MAAIALSSTRASRTAADRISDFAVVDDTIVLSRGSFKARDFGTLDATSFHLGAKAVGGSTAILYAGNKLLYYKDGAGGAKAVAFATIDKGVDLTHLDFEVIA